MWDLVHRISVVQSIASATTASATTTNGVNSLSILGYESVTAVMRISTSGAACTPKIQLSADGTNFYDADAASYIGGAAPGATTAAGDVLLGLQYISSSAANAASIANTALIYARVAVTTNAVTSTTFQADFILGHPRHSGSGV